MYSPILPVRFNSCRRARASCAAFPGLNSLRNSVWKAGHQVGLIGKPFSSRAVSIWRHQVAALSHSSVEAYVSRFLSRTLRNSPNFCRECSQASTLLAERSPRKMSSCGGCIWLRPCCSLRITFSINSCCVFNCVIISFVRASMAALS